MNCIIEDCTNVPTQNWRGISICDEHMVAPALIDGLYEITRQYSPDRSFIDFVKMLASLPALDVAVQHENEPVQPITIASNSKPTIQKSTLVGNKYPIGPCVYLIGCKDDPELFKIGISRTFKQRLYQIKRDSGHDVYPVALFYTDQHRAIEAELHSQFAGKRTYGEWFRLSDVDTINALETCEALLLGMEPE